MKGVTLPTETVFVMEMSPIKFGLGATDEIGFDAARLGLGRVLIFTDRNLAEIGPARARARPPRARKASRPRSTTASRWSRPIGRWRKRRSTRGTEEFDGSSRSAAAARSTRARRSTCSPAIPRRCSTTSTSPSARASPVPGPLRPLIAVPTTAGTGSETTAVAVTHVLDQNVKAGVSHRLLRPTLGDRGPAQHAHRPAGGDGGRGRRHPHARHRVVHDAPVQRARPSIIRRIGPPTSAPTRPATSGARRPSSTWRATCGAPCSTASTSRRACTWPWPPTTPGSASATPACTSRTRVAYPIAGLVRDYVPTGYRTRHPLIPHGMSVILTAPAAFRFTYATAPERHLRAAELMGVSGGRPRLSAERREALPRRASCPSCGHGHPQRADRGRLRRERRDRADRGHPEAAAAARPAPRERWAPASSTGSCATRCSTGDQPPMARASSKSFAVSPPASWVESARVTAL